MLLDSTIDLWLCAFVIGGTAKPQTFLWSYTSVMAVHLTFELDCIINMNRI